MEGWTMARSNMNGQLWIDQDRVEIVAVTEQKIDSDGVYTGTIFTPDFTRQELQAYQKEMLKIGGILQEEGYKGICGIDSIVSTQGELYPLIEINARLTQVTYLLPLVLKLTNHEPHVFYVESVQHSFSLDRELSFPELLDLLSDTVKTDDQNKLFVNTFAAHNSVKTGRWRYRVQVLFYGKERTKVKAMIQTFHSFVVHGVENVG
ncbi:[Butirosin acyl-carrier protein]--L-glutamate ligase [compost metagenome]